MECPPASRPGRWRHLDVLIRLNQLVVLEFINSALDQRCQLVSSPLVAFSVIGGERLKGMSEMLLIVRAEVNYLLRGVLFTLKIHFFVVVKDLLVVSSSGDSKATSICSHLLPTYHRIGRASCFRVE